MQLYKDFAIIINKNCIVGFYVYKLFPLFDDAVPSYKSGFKSELNIFELFFFFHLITYSDFYGILKSYFCQYTILHKEFKSELNIFELFFSI